VILPLNYAETYDGVIHLAKSLVVPPIRAGLDQAVDVDHLEGLMEDIEVRRIGERRLGTRSEAFGHAHI
jgi:hypothetical protein